MRNRLNKSNNIYHDINCCDIYVKTMETNEEILLQ